TILKSTLCYQPPFLIYKVSGRSFLKQMVRNIVGTLVDIGKGKIKKNVKEILNNKDRKTAGATAPAKGLFLEEIKYLKILD
ncbi:MAG: tRNA pseudouridine(38-40) synthase TruA, partial [Candidatus Dadabacteria bacterium]